MPKDDRYELAPLPNGHWSVRETRCGEVMHPGTGPASEAEALYVRPLRVAARLTACREPFVVWDVGLGAAANVLTTLRLLDGAPGRLRIESFDHTLEPLRFALGHQCQLGYFGTHSAHALRLARDHRSTFVDRQLAVDWRVHVVDFPSFLQTAEIRNIPKPNAIFYDAYSPRVNPGMWTLNVFNDLFALLDAQVPCGLATYSRSTMTRVALLLAGFFVGTGGALAHKEETTLAANDLSLIAQPLDLRWLDRVRRSSSAEPLRDATYRCEPLSATRWSELSGHIQFQLGRSGEASG
jgi:hypothetical protein